MRTVCSRDETLVKQLNVYVACRFICTARVLQAYSLYVNQHQQDLPTWPTSVIVLPPSAPSLQNDEFSRYKVVSFVLCIKRQKEREKKRDILKF